VPGRESGTVMPLAGTAMEYICETRSSLLVRKENLEESIQRIPGLRPAWEAGRRAMIVVPLILENEVIGTLSIFSCKPDAYTARDLSTVERVATQIAGAVANAQLFRERQLAEEELKRSEERFRDLYDTAPVGYHEYDVEGRMTRVNRTELEMLGYTREEMIGQYMWKFNVGEDIVRQEILEKLKGLRPPGRALQRTYRRKDGTTLTVLIEDRLNKDEGGNITGIRCTIQDITEHKRMEGALRESEDRWQFALQGSGDGVWDWNPQTNQIYYSSQWKAMIGFRDEEVSDTLDEWEKRVHPDDSPSVKAKIGEHLRGESQIYTSEHRVLCKDGSYKWILDRGKVVSRSEDGRPLRMIGTFSDITDRRKGEEAIRLRNEEVAQERRNLQLIFDSVQVGLVLVDGDGEIRRANYNFAKSVGRPLEEVLNRRPGEAIFCASLSHTDRRCGDTPDCRKCPIRGLLNRVLGEGTKVWGLEISIKIIRKGELRSVWLNLNGTPLTVDGHRHALVSVIDTTSRKNMELSLAAAKEAAEAADRAKSKFLANMSHEIRTPMNGVIGMTGLLLDTPLSPEQRQYAELARSSGESLLLLINDILDFSKIEARKLELDSVDFDLRATLEDVVEMLAFKAQEKGLEMVCLLDPDTPSWLRGDPGRLRQIIVNLSANAVKFTAQGGVTIRAKVAAEDDHSVTLRFAITDTGIGIPKDKQSILFSPFTQIDGSITRKYGGTGLGLAISRQLVDLMGGRIGVESEEGKGSTFWFTAAFDRSPSVGAQEHRPAADLKGVRVLVVEHHGASRLQITTLLTSWGCDVDEATDGKSAMAMLLQSAHSGDPFQIALIANPLPDQEGTELGRRIKENREIREVRLVLLTSLGQRGDAARVEKIGFSGYLTKPVRQSQLRECLGLVSGRKEDPEEKTSRPLVTRHTITESLKRRVRILLAEDNPTSRMVALKILEKLGYRADAVDDGRKAIETLRDTPYDLVLMDCQMPEMDGFEATRCIRSGESGVSNPGIPIIALTAHAMKGDREVCLETGMNDYLAKPIRPEELAASLDRWLGRAANERAAVGAILESSPPVISEAASPEKGGGPSDSEFGGEGVFDRDGFMNRIMGDMELARTLAEGFLADMPVQIKKLKAAIGTGDSSLAGKQAHRIKGAALTIGGIAFQKIAYSMELAGKAGNLKMLGAQMSQLEEEFENLKEFIQKTWSMQENPRKGGKNESN
jgi:PAS domain S-box-containing protein